MSDGVLLFSGEYIARHSIYAVQDALDMFDEQTYVVNKDVFGVCPLSGSLIIEVIDELKDQSEEDEEVVTVGDGI